MKSKFLSGSAGPASGLLLYLLWYSSPCLSNDYKIIFFLFLKLARSFPFVALVPSAWDAISHLFALAGTFSDVWDIISAKRSFLTTSLMQIPISHHQVLSRITFHFPHRTYAHLQASALLLFVSPLGNEHRNHVCFYLLPYPQHSGQCLTNSRCLVKCLLNEWMNV